MVSTVGCTISKLASIRAIRSRHTASASRYIKRFFSVFEVPCISDSWYSSARTSLISFFLSAKSFLKISEDTYVSLWYCSLRMSGSRRRSALRSCSFSLSLCSSANHRTARDGCGYAPLSRIFLAPSSRTRPFPGMTLHPASRS